VRGENEKAGEMDAANDVPMPASTEPDENGTADEGRALDDRGAILLCA
jgi:hypothetical protein